VFCRNVEGGIHKWPQVPREISRLQPKYLVRFQAKCLGCHSKNRLCITDMSIQAAKNLHQCEGEISSVAPQIFETVSSRNVQVGSQKNDSVQANCRECHQKYDSIYSRISRLPHKNGACVLAKCRRWHT
jgi:hypothetical protein